MNMIVCTCDICGTETKKYDTMVLSFNAQMQQRQICPDCKTSAINFIKDFLDHFSINDINDINYEEFGNN